jgi:hypothetical protein
MRGDETDRKLPPEEAFTREVEDWLRGVGITAQRGEAPLSLKVSGPAGGPFEVLLRNLFADAREVPPEERASLFQHFFAILFEGPPHDALVWPDVRARLRPALRSASFANDPSGRPRPDWPVRRPLPFLAEVLVVDLPGRMQYVTASQLASWGIGLDEALAIAHSNLLEHGDPTVRQWVPDAPIFEVASGDCLESSRPLLPGWLHACGQLVEGRPIACEPHRDLCLIAGDADPAIVRRLADIADAEYRGATRSISPALYTMTDDGLLVPYARDDVHEVARGHRVLALAEYAEQKARLEASFEEDELDVFVASHALVDTGEGFVTYCSWAEDVHSLLPYTDLVILGSPTWAFSVRWPDLVRLVGDKLVRRDDLVPPRAEVRAWPDAPTLRALWAARDGFYEKGEPPP